MNRFEKARNALEDFDDFARMGGFEVIGAYDVLKEFIAYAESLEEFIEDAMKMHSNLDIDVEIVRRIRDEDKNRNGRSTTTS